MLVVRSCKMGGTAAVNGIMLEEIKKTAKSLLVGNLPLYFYFGFSP
jgi:hypothetical protein